MSLSPSLRNRVRRLEDAVADAKFDRAQCMRLAREARLAMTPQQLADDRREYDAKCIAALAEPDAPYDTAAEKLQTFRRRRGRRLIAAGAAT